MCIHVCDNRISFYYFYVSTGLVSPVLLFVFFLLFIVALPLLKLALFAEVIKKL